MEAPARAWPVLGRLARWSPARGAAAVLFVAVGLACQAPSPGAVPTPRPPRPNPPPATLTPAPGLAGNAENGRALIIVKGCAGCHTVPGVEGATGVIGPRLNNVALRATLAGESIPNSPETMVSWIMDPPSLKPGTQMPKLGLTEEEAKDITAYLYSQPYNPSP